MMALGEQDADHKLADEDVVINDQDIDRSGGR